MGDTVETPPLIEVLRVALEAAAKELRVFLPGTVEEYDAKRGTVNVRIDVGEYVRVAGKERPEHDPVLVDVPVEWPGAGGAVLVFPLRRGDSGRVLFGDRSLDEWKENATGAVLARDRRHHHIADAAFAPGLRRPASPWKGAKGDAVRTDAVTLGYEGTSGAEGMQIHITPAMIALGKQDPAYAVALAEKVEADLKELRDVFAAWQVAGTLADAGALKTALTTAGIIGPTSTWGTGLGSSKVKVDG